MVTFSAKGESHPPEADEKILCKKRRPGRVFFFWSIFVKIDIDVNKE